MECVEDEYYLKLFKQLCSLYETTYNPNLSACFSSSIYYETEGCFSSDECGQAWIEKNDYEYKFCHRKHLVYNLREAIPKKRISYSNDENICKNECLVDFFDGNDGISRENIDNTVKDCICAF